MSRRNLFELSGLALAAAAFPAALRAAPLASNSLSSAPTQTVGPVMERLSVYMSEASGRELPAEVNEKAKQHILDTIAAMISGAELVPGRAALEFARSYGGKEVATVVASNLRCGPVEAAMVNGVMAHGDETDDSHAPSQCHPGCGVVPAALAAGEQFGVTGTHFMRSVVLGYDIGPRFTMTLGSQAFETNTHWSTHSIAPLFGAAAAAGCAAKFNAEQMRTLLGYTAQQSSGLASWHRDIDHIQKAFVFGGMNARNGVTSALLVEAGWTGVEDILSGKDNFFEAYNPKADPAGLIDKLGERYEVTRTNIKKWPVGSPIQAALDAIALLRKQHPFTADQVREVSVHLATDEATIVDNREIPDICVQHMVAVLLLKGTISFDTAHNKALLKDPAVLQERAKVKLVKDDALERLMPLRVAVVNVTLSDGTQLSQRVDNVRGTPENPMTTEEIATKARDLITPVLGAAKCNALVQRLLTLESVADIRELRPLLQRGD